MRTQVHEELVASADAASLARRLIGQLLDELGWSDTGRVDVLLAVNEAVTNASKHAYPPGVKGPVLLDAHTLTGPNGVRRLCVRVTDHGSPAADKPAVTEGTRKRPTGLAIMRATSAHMSLRSDATGTRVTMISAPE